MGTLEHADGFGVRVQITCSPDSPTGVGAVAKLTVNGYGRAMSLHVGNLDLERALQLPVVQKAER